jgi:hypothetical protein
MFALVWYFLVIRFINRLKYAKFLPSWFIVCNVLAMNTAEKLTKQQLNNQTPKRRNNDRNRLNSNKQD